MALTPTYHVFEMYKVHHDATLLPLDLQCEDYSYGDEAIPAISATASRAATGQVHLTLSNLNPNLSLQITCNLHGLVVKGVSGRILTADSMTAHNTFDAPDMVQPADFDSTQVSGTGLNINLPAKSVVVLAIEE